MGGGLVGRRDEAAAGRGAVGGGVVGDRARVEVGLGHGMDGGAGRRLSGGQGRGEADRGSVGLVVADGDGVDGDVAGVGDRVAVADLGARGGVRVAAGDGLGEGQDRALGRMGGLAVGRRARLPPAGLPVALAMLVTVPASRSAWVTV